ncbi:MAG: hypothetical protein HQL24_09125 [Candidatus Omnitrophica bacterium]|nr:hypothetical protein [Candidatus Omnitrophota bacterium]
MISDFLKKLSDQEKKILYVTIVLVTVALLDRLFLGPALDKVKLINEEIQQQEIIIQRNARFLQYKDKILNENHAFDKYFVDKINDKDVINAEFLSTVEKLATKLNVGLAKSSPSKINVHKRFIEYFADLDCSGELKNVVSFMHAINSTDDLLKVVKFSMAPKKGSTTQEVNASMTIVKLLIGHNMANEAKSQ